MTKHTLDHEIELYREDNAYVVLVEMEGYDREDLDLTWHDNRLHIEAQHVDSETGRSQVFQRSLSFPKPIDHDAIGASVDDGTLEIELPLRPDREDDSHDIAIHD